MITDTSFYQRWILQHIRFIFKNLSMVLEVLLSYLDLKIKNEIYKKTYKPDYLFH